MPLNEKIEKKKNKKNIRIFYALITYSGQANK